MKALDRRIPKHHYHKTIINRLNIRLEAFFLYQPLHSKYIRFSINFKQQVPNCTGRGKGMMEPAACDHFEHCRRVLVFQGRVILPVSRTGTPARSVLFRPSVVHCDSLQLYHSSSESWTSANKRQRKLHFSVIKVRKWILFWIMLKISARLTIKEEKLCDKPECFFLY